MFNLVTSAGFRWLGGRPAFRVHAKAKCETIWRRVDVFAAPRRNANSRWPRPLWRGTCITWTASVIAVGCDFAEEVLREQVTEPASRERPVDVDGGRLRDPFRRASVGGQPWASASEILAHECGHTWQALRLGWLYLPTGALFTLFREGPHWWNRFENRASDQGQFGGIVNGSVCPELMERFRSSWKKGD